MVSVIAAVLVALPAATASVGVPIAQVADRNCSDFPNQAAAQRYFIEQGGPSADPDNLDDIGPGNGVTCESLRCPCFHDGAGPVPRPAKPKPRRIAARVIAHVDGDALKFESERRACSVYRPPAVRSLGR